MLDTLGKIGSIMIFNRFLDFSRGNRRSFGSVIVLCLIFCQAQASAGSYNLVSDIDDTIKITNVLSPLHAGLSVFYSDTFLGMKELLVELSLPAESVSYLSGSPSPLTSRIHQELIRDQGYPEGSFYLMNLSSWVMRDEIGIFKSEKLKDLAGQSELPFLLVGDDTQSDPEVYDDFQKNNGQERVLHSYIHQVTGRALPDSVIPFHTAFEVALKEVELGRLNTQQAIGVGNAILLAGHPEKLFPSFVICPEDLVFTTGTQGSLDQTLVELSSRMSEYVKSVCVERNKNSL